MRSAYGLTTWFLMVHSVLGQQCYAVCRSAVLGRVTQLRIRDPDEMVFIDPS